MKTKSAVPLLLMALQAFTHGAYAEDIQACADKKNGALRMSSECKATESAHPATKAQVKQGAVQVLANGKSIGAFLGFDRDVRDPLHGWGQRFFVFSPKNYLYTVYPVLNRTPKVQPGKIGSVPTIYFESADCSGQAYSYLGFLGMGNGDFLGQGYVFESINVSGNISYFYAGPESQETWKILKSRINNSDLEPSCQQIDIQDNIAPIYPNNPKVTGVPNTPFPLPITLGY